MLHFFRIISATKSPGDRDHIDDEVACEATIVTALSCNMTITGRNAGAKPADSGLKYSRIVTTGSKEPGTVKIRYKEPLADTSHELEQVIDTADEAFTDNLRLAFIVYVCAEKLRGSDKIGKEEIKLAKKLYHELGNSIQEKNSADLFKLAGILEKSEKELGIGILEEPFPW